MARVRVGSLRPLEVVGAVCIVAYLVVVAVNAAPIGNVGTGPGADTSILVHGARVGLDCLEHGVYRACGYRPDSFTTDVGQFPLLQYLPALALIKMGFSDAEVVTLLARLSFAALTVTLLLVVVGAAPLHWRGWRALLVVAVLSTSILYQSTSSFGECLAATAVLGCVVAARWRRPYLLAVATLAAVLTKETIVPFVALFVYVAGLGGEAERRWPPVKVVVPAATGMLAGLVLTAGFNVFRFGAARNLDYLRPVLRTPVSRRPELVLGLWTAPNVGLLEYATVATLLLGLTAWVAVRNLRRVPHDVLRWCPPAAVTVAVAGHTVLLASWWAPFGWDAYGSRLMIPILPAAVLVAVYSAESDLTALVRRVTAGAVGRAFVAAAVVVAGFPQFVSPWTWLDTIRALQAPSAACVGATVFSDQASYYRCMSSTIWRLQPLALRATVSEAGLVALLAGAILAVGCGVLVASLGAAQSRDVVPRSATGAPSGEGSVAADGRRLRRPAIAGARCRCGGGRGWRGRSSRPSR